MLAEAIHSIADATNQFLLLIGQRRVTQRPDRLHPFGYGRNRYFYAFVVALVLFSLGSLVAFSSPPRGANHAARGRIQLVDVHPQLPQSGDCRWCCSRTAAR